MTEETLQPGFTQTRMASIRGNRVRTCVTATPSIARPGETLYIDTPKLEEGLCLVPGSLHLLFNFEVTGTKSHYMNNLSKLLQGQMVMKISTHKLYDCKPSAYMVYSDLWKTNSERLDMVEYGISSQNHRKLVSNDDTGTTTGDAQKVSDALAYSVYSKRQRIRLDYIVKDYGLYAPFTMTGNPKFTLKLPPADQVLVAQTGEALGTYTLGDMELEYEVIINKSLSDEITDIYKQGRSLYYEYLTLIEDPDWPADSTQVNISVTAPTKSMRAIVLLFQTKDRIDSEEFVYPNIDSVGITIGGVNNMIYSEGLPKNRFYDECKRLFKLSDEDQYMSFERFYKDKFALVIDLRPHAGRMGTGHGKKVDGDNTIKLTIKKRAYTSAVKCLTYIVSDGQVNFGDNTCQGESH